MVESASTKIDSLANFLIFRCFQGIANQQTRHNQNQPIATGAGPSLKNMNPNEKSVTRPVRGLIVDEREDEKEVVEVVAVGGFKRRLLVFAKQLKSATSRRRLDISR